MPRFLVVDNNPSSVGGISKLLREDGHDVAMFTTGADAVQAVSQEAFDAVVTDLEMPHVDGRAVVHATREHNPGACLVVVSGRADEHLQTLVQAGACIVADKPFDYDEVTKAIGDCRARGGPGDHRPCHMRSRPHHQFVPLRRNMARQRRPALPRGHARKRLDSAPCAASDRPSTRLFSSHASCPTTTPAMTLCSIW